MKETILLFIGIAMIAIPIIFSLIPIEAQPQPTITINQFTAKIVVTFDKSGITETALRNYLINNVWSDVRDILITKLDNNFESYTLNKSLKVNNIGGDRWEFYPKFVISGETTLTKQQLRNGFDSTLDNIKAILQTHMDAQGATNVKYHIHKSVGSVDENP